MLSRILGLAVAVVFVLGAGSANAQKEKPKDNKVVIGECIMMHNPATKEGGATNVKIGKTTYVVQFCCGGCKPAFDKLSKKDKEAKVKEYLAKKKAADATDVKSLNACPLSGHPVKAEAGTCTVGNFKVGFCCTNCKANFEAKSKDEQEKIVAELAKK